MNAAILFALLIGNVPQLTEEMILEINELQKTENLNRLTPTRLAAIEAVDDWQGNVEELCEEIRASWAEVAGLREQLAAEKDQHNFVHGLLEKTRVERDAARADAAELRAAIMSYRAESPEGQTTASMDALIKRDELFSLLAAPNTGAALLADRTEACAVIAKKIGDGAVRMIEKGSLRGNNSWYHYYKGKAAGAYSAVDAIRALNAPEPEPPICA